MSFKPSDKYSFFSCEKLVVSPVKLLLGQVNAFDKL